MSPVFSRHIASAAPLPDTRGTRTMCPRRAALGAGAHSPSGSSPRRWQTIAIAAVVVVALGGCTTLPPRENPSRDSTTLAAVPPRDVSPGALPPREFWVDLVRGEQVSDLEVLEDLSGAGVIFVGEAHTVDRHHALQLSLLRALFSRGVPLVLCLEQLEAADQPAIDRYNRSQVDFDTLARETKWAGKWTNYPDYRPLCEFARQHGIPIRALNAPADAIRAVSRGGGIAHLSAERRAQLPADLAVDNPAYERLMNLQLAVHAAADPAKLRPMFEAQMARDETMAANIISARGSGNARRTAFVVVGAGHIRFGLGTADSVRRRVPDIIDRLVLATESDELQLTAREKAASREVTITHGDLRTLGRPPADYLRVLPITPRELPPGHPPLPAAPPQ